MRISGLILLLIVFFGFYTKAQDSINYSWNERILYPIDSTEVWTVDALGNVYISSAGVISKIDSAGVFKFGQSIKSLGKMEQLIPINTMKLVHFSAEQQTLCYFDNTLTQTSDCLELSDREIVNAKLVSASSRSDQIWVFDNLNSTLVLLSVDGTSQTQKIENLRGVLNINNITQIIERNNHLYLLDSEKGVYIFDLYGSLIDFKAVEGVRSIDAYENTLFMLTESELKIVLLSDGSLLSTKLPDGNFHELKYINQFFYLRSLSNVHKFTLQISE